MPEQVFARAVVFSDYLQGLDDRLRMNAQDTPLWRSAVLANKLPTLRIERAA
jgi:hypothetical protein